MLACRAPEPGEDGFVLIGVVMFVLALTILGLSLFSLSGYEASFLGRSRSMAQAFYDATGGIDRARYMLLTRDKFSSVKDTLGYDGPEGVVYARARYVLTHEDSLAPRFSTSGGKQIEIRVLAVRSDVRCMVESRFTPTLTDDYYKRLVTSASFIRVPDSAGVGAIPTIRKPQTYLTGYAWQNFADSSWSTAPTESGFNRHPIRFGGVPTPELSAYWAIKTAGAPLYNPPPGSSKFILTALPGQTQYFRTTFTGSPDFSLKATNISPEIHVTGTVIWMFDKGVTFDHGVIAIGQSGIPGNDRLVMIARPTTSLTDSMVGIRFFGGLNSTGATRVPVILVSDGRVNLEHSDAAGSSTRIDYLSVFAKGALFIGPDVGHGMYLTHSATAPEDAYGGLIDYLYGQGALPNAPGTQLDKLKRVSGTWRQVTESNPD